MKVDLWGFWINARVVLDIALVAFLLYQVYRLVAQSRAVPILIGLLLFILLAPVSRFLQLETLGYIFEIFSNFLIIAVIVTLQPELRRMFYQMGQAGWVRSFMTGYQVPVEEITGAVQTFAEQKTGALLVLVNKTGLRQLSESGIPLHARLSRELLLAIFYEQNPLHDGAVIIEGMTVAAAATYLPLSSSSQLKRTHGARHRAGLGITEESDALSIIVSETTGNISCCFFGEMRENVDINTLKSLLTAFNGNRLSDEWQVHELLSKQSRSTRR